MVPFFFLGGPSFGTREIAKADMLRFFPTYGSLPPPNVEAKNGGFAKNK